MNRQLILLQFLLCLCLFSCRKKTEPPNTLVDNVYHFSHPANGEARDWLITLSLHDKDFDYVSDIDLVKFSLDSLKDSLFYKRSYESLEEKIFHKIDFNIYPSFIHNKVQTDSAILKFKEKLRSIPSPLIEDQIWDEEFRLAINPLSSQAYDLKDDAPGKYLAAIRKLDTATNFNDFINEVDGLRLKFEAMPDEELGSKLLFKLLIRFVQFDQNRTLQAYARGIADTLISKSRRSNELTNRMKARWAVGCAKLFGYKYFYNSFASSFNWLKLAQGYCELLPEDSVFLDKIHNIKFKSTFNLYEKDYEELIELTMVDLPRNYEYGAIAFDYKSLQYLINRTHYELHRYKEYFQETGIIGNRKLLDLASSFYVLNVHFKKDYGQEDENLQYQYLLLLADYYRLKLKLDTALRCLYKALEIQLLSNNPKLQTNYLETTRLIELLLKDMGQAPLEVHTPNGFYKPTNFAYKIPRDSRLWKKHHIDSLKVYLKHADITGGSINSSWENHSTTMYMDQTVKAVLRKIGRIEAFNNNAAEAYYFFTKSDSVIVSRAFRQPVLSEESTEQKLYANKFYLQQEIRSRNEKFIIAVIAATVISLLTVYVFYLRKKAIREAQFSAYKTNIWQEFGHTPGELIDFAFVSLTRKGLSVQELIPLIKLRSIIDNLFKSIVLGNSKEGNPLENEIHLADEYIKYTNLIKNSSVELDIDKTIPISLPPALLLSCVRNAIIHGELTVISDCKIEISIQKFKRYYLLTVKNNGKPFALEKLSLKNLNTASTGFRNMNSVLQYFNFGRRIKNPVLWDNLSEPFYKTATYLKIKV